MRLETIERLVEAADFSDFRTIARRYLELRGYRLPESTDGWSDGGRDIRVYQLPPNPSPIAVQTSVERRWQTKLREDAIKAEQNLGVSQVLYISSRRLAETEFANLADSLWREKGITVHKADSQSIAGTFSDQKRLLELLELLGIPVQEVTQTSRVTEQPPLAEDTAYAYIFFGGDASNFQTTVIERAIISAVCYSADRSRASLEEVVVKYLGLGDPQRMAVQSSIDRLLQQGILARTQDGYRASEAEYERHRAAVSVREHQLYELKGAVEDVLKEGGLPRDSIEPTQEAVMEDLGALMMAVGTSLPGTMDHPTQWQMFDGEIKDRMRHLDATLASGGLGRASVNAVRNSLTEVAMASPLAHCLVAGELFVRLSGIATPRLVQAIGSRGTLTVVLDANVAIPVLANNMYEAASQRYFRAAHRAYKQLLAHDMDILVPHDYVEEMASHLIAARDNYAAIVDTEPDLEFSTNAFVAHYAHLARRGGAPAFDRYLQAFGLSEQLQGLPFSAARDRLMQTLRRLLERYGFRVRRLGKPTVSSMRRAERALAFGARELGQDRPERLMSHDARTLGYLLDAEGSGDEALLFMTWDRLHAYVGSEEALGWSILNPAAASDLLSMARGMSDDEGWISPMWVAMSMDDKEAELGARVLDRIVEIEGADLYDGELLTMAREFKASYVEASREVGELTSIETAWAEWKRK